MIQRDRVEAGTPKAAPTFSSGIEGLSRRRAMSSSENTRFVRGRRERKSSLVIPKVDRNKVIASEGDRTKVVPGMFLISASIRATVLSHRCDHPVARVRRIRCR